PLDRASAEPGRRPPPTAWRRGPGARARRRGGGRPWPPVLPRARAYRCFPRRSQRASHPWPRHLILGLVNSLGNFPDPEPSAPAPSPRPGITPPPDPFLSEILGQPDAILRAAGLLTDQLGTLTTLARARADRPLLVFTGMGASY